MLFDIGLRKNTLSEVFFTSSVQINSLQLFRCYFIFIGPLLSSDSHAQLRQMIFSTFVLQDYSNSVEILKPVNITEEYLLSLHLKTSLVLL